MFLSTKIQKKKKEEAICIFALHFLLSAKYYSSLLFPLWIENGVHIVDIVKKMANSLRYFLFFFTLWLHYFFLHFHWPSTSVANFFLSYTFPSFFFFLFPPCSTCFCFVAFPLRFFFLLLSCTVSLVLICMSVELIEMCR